MIEKVLSFGLAGWGGRRAPWRTIVPDTEVRNKLFNQQYHVLGILQGLLQFQRRCLESLRRAGSAVAAMYGVSAIPANFLINPQGRIIAKNLRGPALEEKLNELQK